MALRFSFSLVSWSLGLLLGSFMVRCKRDPLYARHVACLWLYDRFRLLCNTTELLWVEPH